MILTRKMHRPKTAGDFPNRYVTNKERNDASETISEGNIVEGEYDSQLG